MAKKFGKFVLAAAAIGTAVGAVYYYLQKRDSEAAVLDDDEDFDDFSDDLDDDTDLSSRNYVPLNRESAEETSAAAASENTVDTADHASDASSTDPAKEDTFTPLTEQVKEAAEERVEEFFNEDNL